jgi:hypothetical protein
MPEMKNAREECHKCQKRMPEMPGMPEKNARNAKRDACPDTNAYVIPAAFLAFVFLQVLHLPIIVGSPGIHGITHSWHSWHYSFLAFMSLSIEH